MKVSIIVPVYNAEKTLERCVESICNQTYKNLDIILVNDGSKDTSGNICNVYAEKDSRIQSVHQENQGQSIARNHGMEICTGAYVMFVDSDDEIPSDAVEQLLKPLKQKEYDVVAGMYSCIRNGIENKIAYFLEEGEISRRPEHSKRYHSIKTESVFGYCWGKIYRQQFLLEHGVVFDDIRKVFMEDTLFNLKVWMFHPSYFIINEAVYRYYIYDNTSSTKVIKDIDQKCKAMIENYIDTLEDAEVTTTQLDLLIPLIARVFCWSMIHNAHAEKKSFQSIKKQVTTFSNSNKIQGVLHLKKSIRHLWKLPSIMQRVFYGVCLVCMKHKWNRIISTVFTALYPFLNRYARAMQNK